MEFTPNELESLCNYQCNLCKEVLISKGNLMSHLRVAHYQKKSKVKKESSEELLETMDPNEYSYKCLQCTHACRTPQKLVSHVIKNHREPIQNRGFECEFCCRIIKSPDRMDAHVRKMHFDKLEFNCKDCGDEFEEFIELRKHRRTHIDDPNDPNQYLRELLCPFPVCSALLDDYADLATHMSEKHDIHRVRYGCNFCERWFPTTHKLKQHIEMYHHIIWNHFCRTCGKKFAQKFQRNEHEKFNHSGTESADKSSTPMDFDEIVKPPENLTTEEVEILDEFLVLNPDNPVDLSNNGITVDEVPSTAAVPTETDVISVLDTQTEMRNETTDLQQPHSNSDPTNYEEFYNIVSQLMQ